MHNIQYLIAREERKQTNAKQNTSKVIDHMMSELAK
jgi:hypothetical protein